MTEREKEYVCDQLCKYSYFCNTEEQLEPFCNICMLNKTRSQLRKEYMQQYYKNKIKPARKKRGETYEKELGNN